MLELTRKPRTDGFVELRAVVPLDRADEVSRAIAEAVEPNVSLEDAFEDMSPGEVLRGARGLREMTQVQLAAKIGVRATTISDMERGRRPIGRATARKLAQALGFSYKSFL